MCGQTMTALIALFQLTAARRRLETSRVVAMILDNVSTHSRPKAAGDRAERLDQKDYVSTHSRPKAAGRFPPAAPKYRKGFNSQPPEGGWMAAIFLLLQEYCFNSQPPEGGWA